MAMLNNQRVYEFAGESTHHPDKKKTSMSYQDEEIQYTTKVSIGDL